MGPTTIHNNHNHSHNHNHNHSTHNNNHTAQGRSPQGEVHTWVALSTEAYAEVAQYCDFREVNVIGGGHGAADAALDMGDRDSFDVQLSRLISADTPYSAVRLGVRCTTTRDLIGRQNNQPIVHDELPQENAGRASTKTDRTSQYSHHGEF